MSEKIQLSDHTLSTETHRSLGDSILFVFDHEFGPYIEILSGHIPGEWRVDSLPIDVLKADVESQLTLLLAGEEYLRKKSPIRYLFGTPVYGDVLNNLVEIKKYRDKEKERFDAKLKEIVTRVGMS